MLKWEKLKALIIKSRVLCLFNVVLEVMGRATGEKEKNGIRIKREEIKLSAFAHHMVLYVKYCKNCAKMCNEPMY